MAPRKKKPLTGKYLHPVSLAKDTNYLKMIDSAKNWLIAQGAFEKDTVLQETGLAHFAKGIRWDFIINTLESEDYSLIAVSQLFFDEEVWKKGQVFSDAIAADAAAQTRVETSRLAGRYTATGQGKRTAGYALARLHGGVLLLYRLEVGIEGVKGKAQAIVDKAAKSIVDPALDADVKSRLTKIAGRATKGLLQ